MNPKYIALGVVVVLVIAYFVIKRKKSQPATVVPFPQPAPTPVPTPTTTAQAPAPAAPVAPVAPTAPAPVAVTPAAAAPVFVAPNIDQQVDGDVIPPGATLIPTSAVASVMTSDEQMAMAMLGKSNDSAKLAQAIAAGMAARGVSQEQIRAAMNSFGGTAGANGGAQISLIRARYGAKLGDAFAGTPFAGYFDNK